ncbi:D-amino-acid transaminase [Kordiimonas sediminis]|uniref:Probable branched-chain-amino-acid aminotransferase n=1 Tax=Kordiimonas sediminis TaxID=1735581 RepID=A0A919E3W2_9PROT|nr:D-amino-acid transaminase [Kordiimonas sediminis]GHF17127.1 D-amino-acid transaminase [Kordiimonas sediminis]
MSRIAYVNGSYVPHDEAYVHIEDRGYQFSDGVYEVAAIKNGKLIDGARHLDRLWRSMEELQIAAPMARAPMEVVLKEVVRQNRILEGIVYIQVTRGVARRDHAFPSFTRPALVMTAKRLSYDAVYKKAQSGIKVTSVPDIRWDRCDIKSISLLPNVLAKQTAREAGSVEAVMFDKDGMITEGSSTNVWMVTKDGTLVTRSTKDNILPGITRQCVMELAEENQMKVEERAFSLLEVADAAEIFITSTTSCAMPVIQFDDTVIGDGKPGPVALRLINAYMDFMNS